MLQESKGGKKIGGMPKEKLAGKFAAGWGEAFKEAGLEQVIRPVAIAALAPRPAGHSLRAWEY